MAEEFSNLDVHHRQPQQQHHQQQRSILQTLDTTPNWSSNHENERFSLDIDIDPFSPPHLSSFVPFSSHLHTFHYISSDSDSDSDSDDCPYSDSGLRSFDCYGNDDHMDFVTDLFASREERGSGSGPDSNFRVFGDEFDSNYTELGLGFGSGIGFSANRGADSGTDGLRVVGLESDSDSEVSGVDYGVGDDETDPTGDLGIPRFHDCFGFEDRRDAANEEELEWEEVDEREGLGLIINRIEELSASSELSFDEEAVRSLEWEVLLAVNNWARPPGFEPENDDGVSYLDVEDNDNGDIYDAEYETIFGQFAQNDSALKGSPPTSKSVIESLPSIVLTKEELEEEKMVCAICKDEILVEEKVTRLPCHHYYHGDCIVPWLGIRNTCPVCRHELPTDDPDYEQRKTQRDGLGLPVDLEVRFNFELLP